VHQRAGPRNRRKIRPPRAQDQKPQPGRREEEVARRRVDVPPRLPSASPPKNDWSLSCLLLWPLIPKNHPGEETMNGRSWVMRVVATFAALLLYGATGHAAEVKVLTSVALKSVFDELSPAFEKKTGHKLTIDYGLAADQKKRILNGEHADLIIL